MGRGGDLAESRRTFSWEDVQKHHHADDAWVVIHGKVYDVSGWHEHPGGKVVFALAGHDASDAFSVFHSKAASEQLESRCIGSIRKELLGEEISPFEREYRSLRTAALREGLFEASTVYYIWKSFSTVAFAAASWAVMLYFPYSWTAVVVAAVLMAFFWQQCGWLSHDYIHHQVFDNRTLGDVAGLIIGNLFQGFSVEWWKNKHNTHHAIPNQHETELGLHDGDPDIDTLPFIAWSTKMAEQARRDGGMSAFSVRNQRLLFFPLLCLARVVWLQQSLVFAMHPLLFKEEEEKKDGAHREAWDGGGRRAPLKYPIAEPLLLFAHYSWIGALMFLTMTPLQALAFFVIAQCLCGLFLAVSFVVGHNGMPVFDVDSRPAFAEMQVLGTRNIDDDVLGFSGWFTGGLHFQVEHHLFPMMPRHNLAKIRPRVEAMCKRHGVRYHSAYLHEGVWEVLDFLEEMSRHIR